MAYDRFKYFEDEEGREQAPAGGLVSPVAGLGASSIRSEEVVKPPSIGSVSPEDPSGSKFVSFERYFNANKEGAAQDASKVAQGVESKAAGALSGLTASQNQFADAVKKGTHTYGGETVDPGVGVPTSSNRGNGLQTQRQGLEGAAQKGTSPGGAPALSLEEAYARSQKGYGGPTSLSDFAPQLGQQFDDAQRGVGQLGDQYGLQGLMKNLKVTDPSATSGTSRFSAGMANAAGSGRFGELQKKYGGLYDTWSRAQKDAAGAVQDARTASDTAAARYGADARAAEGYKNEAEKQVALGQDAGNAASALHEERQKVSYGDLFRGTMQNNSRIVTGAGYGSEQGLIDEGLYNSISDEEWSQYMDLLRASNNDPYTNSTFGLFGSGDKDAYDQLITYAKYLRNKYKKT